MINSIKTRMARYLGRIGEKKKAYRILVGNAEGKRPLGRPRSRCLGNIRIILER
jgi:hypothetical protein